MTRRGQLTYFLAAVFESLLLVAGYSAVNADLNGPQWVPFLIWVAFTSLVSWLMAQKIAHRLIR